MKLLAGLVAIGIPVAAAAQTDAAAIRVPLPLVDLVIVGDSELGITLLASPNLASRQGYEHSRVDRLALDPDETLAWLSRASILRDSALTLAATHPKPFGATLQSDRGRGAFFLGYDRKTTKDTPYLIQVQPSIGLPVCSARLMQPMVDSLIAALRTAATRSHLLAPDPLTGPRRPALSCELDRLPQLTTRPHLQYPPGAHEGRVWPGHINGDAVPTLGFQEFSFRLRS
jgi:hypothetical protein